MVNMSLNSDFVVLSNKGLLVEIFQVVLKLELKRAILKPPYLGTNFTKIGQAAED